MFLVLQLTLKLSRAAFRRLVCLLDRSALTLYPYSLGILLNIEIVLILIIY